MRKKNKNLINVVKIAHTMNRITGLASTGGYSEIFNPFKFDAEPIFWDQYVNPYMEIRSNTLEYVEPTPENFADVEMNDCWSHWHRMIICTDTPNGYVLGTLPVPSAQLIGGSWSLSGTDAAKFAIDASTGQITLADAASVTAAGTLNIIVTTPAGGDYAIQVPVYDKATKGTFYGSSFGFYDSVNGSSTAAYADDERGQAHVGLTVFNGSSQYGTYTERPEKIFMKRGSTFNTAFDCLIKWPTSRQFYDYGDPSAADVKVVCPSDFAGTAMIDDSGAYNATGCIIDGITFDCRGVPDQFFAAAGDNIILRRIKAKNNNPSGFIGFYIRNHNNFVARWLETEHVYGDGFYAIDNRSIFIGFSKWRPALAYAADAGQSVNEGHTDEMNEDIALFANMGAVSEDNLTKGSFANEGNVRYSFEYNYAQSAKFAAGVGGHAGDVYGNFLHSQYSVSGETIFGEGASQSGADKILSQNIISSNGSGRLISISGFNAATEGWEGDEYARYDFSLNCNLGYGGSNMIKATEPTTGTWDGNIGISMSVPTNENQKGDATISGTVASITLNGAYMDVITDKQTHLYTGMQVTIAGDANSANNGTFEMLGWVGDNYASMRLDNPSAVTNASSSATYSATPVYSTVTEIDNNNTTPDYDSAPKLSSIPVLSSSLGGCEELDEITLTYTKQSGHSYINKFMIDGKVVQSNGNNLFIPDLGTSGTNPKKADLSALAALDTPRADFYNNYNKKSLSASVVVTNDTTGYANIYHAKWAENRLRRRITPFVSSTPVYSFDVLDTGTFPSEITVDRNSVAAYRDATGKYKSAAINVGRVHHSPSGAIIGAISETSATRKNTYAFPESGVVTDHFTTGTSDITVVTDNDVPMSSDYTNYNKVWQIDNSGGGGPVTYKFAGTTGSTSPHSMQCWCKIVSGDGYAYLTIGGQHSVYGICPITSRTGAEIGAVEVHPATTSDQLEITLPAGMVVNVSIANMQRHLSVDNNKATGYLTTPILHGPGTQATRDDEFLYITTPASLGFDEDQGTIVMHGSFVGAENTDSGCLSLYKTTDATNEYMYLRASPNGDWLWYGKGGGVESVNMVLPATASRREEYPLDISFAIRWSNVNGFRGTYHQKDVGTDASVNTATGIDRLAFYRHDVGTQDDSCLVITKFQIYDVELDNDEMDALSHREYGYVGVTVAQSNADIRKRGFPLKRADALTTKAPGSSTLILDYPHHGILSPGGKITLAGATTVDGITSTQINTICTITAIVDEDTLEFDVASDVATSGSVTGGGANMTVTFYQNSNTGGPDWISTRLYEQFLPNPIIIRGPNYWDGTTNLDYGGGALAKSTGTAGVGYWVDDDDPANLTDGTDLALLINTVRYDYGVYGRVDDFHVDLGPYEEGRTVSEINGIIKQCMQYFVTRLKEIGGAGVNINFQMWSKRFNTNDDVTWAWREMLREIATENTNVYIIAEPYNHDLDTNSNAHFDSEVGYVKTYLAGDRQILKRNGFDLGMTDLPELSSAEYVSGTNQIVLTFTTDDNTTLSSGNTTILAQMFQVLVDSVESAVTVASVSGNQVTLTISDTITGANSVNVAYPYRLIDYDQDASDENDAGTAALVDSGPYSLPVRQFNSVASVA